MTQQDHEPEIEEPTDDEEPAPRPRLTIMRVLVVYGGLGAIGWGLSTWFLDRPPLTHPDVEVIPVWQSALIGAGAGLLVVGFDVLLDRLVPFFRNMTAGFRSLLGDITPTQAVIFAFASAVGEELLFRGALQPWIGIVASSIVFGLLHIAPDRRLWPWPLMATAMGFAFAGLFLYTGDILAPIVAHFTINYFGFMRIGGWKPSSDTDTEQPAQ